MRANPARSLNVKIYGINCGSKPCPHCNKTISANKEMCFDGVTAFGTLKAFDAEQKRLADVAAQQMLGDAIVADKLPKPRKARARVKPEATAEAVTEKKPRKPRAKKTPVEVG